MSEKSLIASNQSTNCAKNEIHFADTRLLESILFITAVERYHSLGSNEPRFYEAENIVDTFIRQGCILEVRGCGWMPSPNGI